MWRTTADRAGWALRYARLNVLALRKFVKKYDKVMRGHFGRDFLQVRTSAASICLGFCCVARNLHGSCEAGPGNLADCCYETAAQLLMKVPEKLLGSSKVPLYKTLQIAALGP